MRCDPEPIAKLSVSAKSYSVSPSVESGCGTSRTSSPSPIRMKFGKLFWTMPEVVAVIRDVGRQEQRVAPADDALLALIGSVPVDFQLELVRLDDLGRRAEAFAELREEGDVAVRDGLVVGEAGVGELLGAPRGGPIDQRRGCARRSTVCAPAPRESITKTNQPARGAARREESTHDWRISPGVTDGATRSMSFRRISRRARRRSPSRTAPRLVPVWRDVLLDTETPVAAFAKLRERPVRVPARVRAGRRRDVGALHVHGHRAARRVEARGRRRPGLDAGARLAQRPPPRRSARRSRDAAPRLRAGGAAGDRRVLERRGRLFRLRRRARHRAASGAAGARRRRPDALFVFTDALVIFDNLRSQARVVAAARVERDASDAELQARVRRGARARSTRRSHGCAARGARAARARTRARRRPRASRATTRQVHGRRRARSRSTSSPATRFRCRSRGASTCRSTSRRPICIARCA